VKLEPLRKPGARAVQTPAPSDDARLPATGTD